MDDFLKAVFAGLVIGLGGYVFLNVEDKVIGAFLFSIGLLAVCMFGLLLYTGKVCNKSYLMAPGNLLCIFLGNFIGVLIIGMIAYLHTDISDTAEVLTIAKLSKPLPIVLLDGIVCGICIAIAVKGYGLSDGIGKYLSVILGVMVFILAGSEHVIADLFYFVASGEFSIRMIWFILVTLVGNTLGGAMFMWI